ncbi:type 1 glutamine amidotransferase domain-containing protein [Candidatus Solincola sp.]|nr:type 1 glutamine amidotransferase domain-containing protein [Actinomycetota bacterium]MDI7252415.1 type 1 glutamine amidotransferase domain-containing protein [Actinomycetota bacterium]
MDLEKKRVAVLIGKGFQDQEGTVPIEFLRREGAGVITIGPETGEIRGLHGAVIEVERTLEEVSPEDFDALVIPGGRSPAHLRRFPAAVDFVARFAATGKPVAAICHGGQLLAAAGLVKGLTMTGYPKIKEEMEAAGARFVDREVVVDGNIITSRVPDDLPVFNATLKEMLLGRRGRE